MAKSSKANIALPEEARQALKALGRNIRDARKAQKIRQKDFATRCLLSVDRLRKLEKGDPTVGMGALAQALYVLEMTDDLKLVAGQRAYQGGPLWLPCPACRLMDRWGS